MKPIRLQWQAFGPYRQDTKLNFDDLEESLFLISGPTGGGKTTILDAICFALYCRATGGRRDFKSMRCVSAEEEIPTKVEFDFQLGREKYRFRRELYRHLKRGSEEYVTKDRHECFIQNGNEWELLVSGAESVVRKKAEEILHLDCEQFSQVIVLPQGEFLKFLRASSKEKGEMLETLFSVHMWKNLTDQAATVTRKLSEDMKGLVSAQKSLLEKENFTSPEEMVIAQQEIEKQKKCLEEQSHSLAEKYQKSAARLVLAENWQRSELYQRDAAEKLEKAMETARQAEKELIDAQSKKLESEVLRKQSIQTAQEQTALQSQYEMAEKFADMQKKAFDLQNTVLQETEEIANRKNQQANLLKKIEIGKEYVKAAESSAQRWSSLFETTKSLEKKIDESLKLIKLGDEKIRLENKLADTVRILQDRTTIWQIAAEQLLQKENILRQNKAAELAFDLQENQPCPVCGSCHHPHLAVAKDEPNLAENIIKLREAKERAEKEQLQIQNQCEVLKAQAENIQKEYKEQQESLRQLTDLPLKDLQKEYLQVTAELEKHKKRADSLPKAKIRLEEYTKWWERENQEIAKQELLVQDKKTQAATLLQTIPKDFGGESTLKRLLIQKREKEEEYKRLLSQSEELLKIFETAQHKVNESQTILKRAQEDLQKAEQEFKEQQEKWGEDSPPQVEELRQQTEQYRLQSLTISEQLGNITAKCESLNNSIAILGRWQNQLAEAEKKYSKAARISQSLTGNNPYKMPILQYVLRMMLDEILVYANRFFATLSRGRYALCRKEEPSGGNAISGLDLEVLDGSSMQKRSIETLSGGEQFLASLSLAFGLSDVVQRHSGAVQMDSLFIDEGFGSLDQETLDIAMKAIGVLRENGRMVGIISHVSELKQRIPTQIIVHNEPGRFVRAVIKK